MSPDGGAISKALKAISRELKAENFEELVNEAICPLKFVEN